MAMAMTLNDAEVVEDASTADNGGGDANAIRNREKSDIWHEFKNMPLKKDDTASPSIHMLLRAATHTINEIEEERVRHDLASRGINDFYEHFFFNKEWWYRRVRIPPRKGEVSSDYLLFILDYLQTNEVFKEFVTDELAKHITGWARRCREG